MGIKIHGMRLGGFPVPLDMLFDAGGVRTTQRLDDGDIVNGLYQCPSLSYIIEHPDAGLIAFETGVSTNWNEEWLSDWTDLVDLSGITPEVCIEAQLRTRGWGPEDFGHVIQGHLHADHAGGLRVFEEAGATIVVHEDEWRYCVSNIADADLFFIRADWNFVSRAPQMLVYGDQEIFQDVWTISLPGHTPGQMGLLVRLDFKRLGLADFRRDVFPRHDRRTERHLGRQHAARGLEQLDRQDCTDRGRSRRLPSSPATTWLVPNTPRASPKPSESTSPQAPSTSNADLSLSPLCGGRCRAATEGVRPPPAAAYTRGHCCHES